MSAYFEFLFYSLVSFVIFPVTLFNFLILNTNILPDIKPFIISSGSMEPAVATGSIIYTIKEKGYKEGDIITFTVKNENISHRIVGQKIVSGQTYYITKGDANLYPDEDLVGVGEIYGKIHTSIPYVGKAILLLRGKAS